MQIPNDHSVPIIRETAGRYKHAIRTHYDYRGVVKEKYLVTILGYRIIFSSSA